MNPSLSRHWMGMRTCRSQCCRFARAWKGLAFALCLVVLLAAAGCGSEAIQAQHADPTPDQKPADELAVAELRGDAQPLAAPAASLAPVEHRLLHAGFDPESPCTCPAAVLSHQWCWRCNVGYIAGRRIECTMLFEALDPHGHELDNESLQLQMCREAIRSDGHCDAVGFGFVGGKAYFTRLTWGLAKGQTVDPAALGCGTCGSHASEPGWCDSCSRGIVGNVAFAERDLFERTRHEYQILAAAIDRAPVCEFCACAMVAHLTCPKCQISYESGASAASTRQGDADPMSFMAVKPDGSATSLRDPTHQTQEEIQK